MKVAVHAVRKKVRGEWAKQGSRLAPLAERLAALLRKKFCCPLQIGTVTTALTWTTHNEIVNDQL